MQRVAKEFSERSCGVFSGVIGAIDGWLVRIRCPSTKLDGVRNPGHYFSRKGFYALNVQAMVSKKKKVLWSAIGNLGSLHDSACFKESKLCEILTNKREEFQEKGYFLVGDSAYALRPYMMVPYDKATIGSAEDSFNFYLSSSRI